MHDKGTTTSRPQRGKGKGTLGSVKGSVHTIRRSREALLLTELTEREKGTSMDDFQGLDQRTLGSSRKRGGKHRLSCHWVLGANGFMRHSAKALRAPRASLA